MKKVKGLIITLLAILIIACDDNGSSATRAGIIAEDFIKERVISPSTLEYDIVGVDEEYQNSYHVVAYIKAENALGMKVPRKASVRLRYVEGDWTEKNNWILESIRILNEATGEEEEW